MRTAWRLRILLTCSSALALAAGCGDDAAMMGETIDCEVAIVGGGVGGLHTAYRLAPKLGAGVCLLEKEAQLGGRIKDVAADGTATSPRVGAGARRIMETQDVLFALATELNLQLESPPTEADLIEARGKFAFAKDDLTTQYPALGTNPDPNVDFETHLYDLLRMGPERKNIANYSDFRAYTRKVVGNEGYEFLRDMSRFRADFEYPLDARGYLDYLDEEWDTCCTPSYPVGGMSSFIRGMETKTAAGGVRIFKSTPVSAINKTGTGYRLTSGNKTYTAKKIVIAIPPYWLNQVEGDVVDRIRAQPQFQQIIGVRVVTVTQWWSDAWWLQIQNPKAMKDNRVWRAWTTDHCLNFIEIPFEPYAAAQKVTRSVYDDDIRCVQFWEELAKQSPDKVEAEIQKGLTYLFNDNGVSSPKNVTVPKPLKTQIQVWPDAWHWLGAGATFTNAQIVDWAVQPLTGEDVGLVGESYYLSRSGWSDAAYKSSIKLLNAKYGLSLSTKQALRPAPGASRRLRSDGGH